MILPVLIIFSLFRNVALFEATSTFGNTILIAALTYVLIYGFGQFGISFKAEDLFTSPVNIPEFFGLMLFAAPIPVICLFYMDALDDEKKFVPSMVWSLTSIATICIILGILGFLVFQSDSQGIQGNIFLNLPGNAIESQITKTGSSLVILVSYPLSFVVISGKTTTKKE